MNWDQIETKWTLMTRRIRADFGAVRTDSVEGSRHALMRRDARTASIAEGRIAAVAKESECKTAAK